MRHGWWVVFGMVLGCGSSTPGAGDGGAPADASRCVPDRTQWNTSIRASVQRQCGACHSDSPQFGAPFSLLDYDADIAGAPGARRVDRMVARLMAGTMPPSGTPAPPDDVASAIVGWASCGASTPPPGRGLRASAPLFRSPSMAPAGMPSFEMRADNFAVTRALTERYQCYTFDVPVTEARFARRFEILLDHTEVVHHVVLLRDTERTAPTGAFECGAMPSGSQFLYAWAPGQDALQFPEGGLRMMPGERFVLQIHYNNGAGREGFTDRSGVKIFHDVPNGAEYGMVAMGPNAFSIPAHSTGSVESACTIAQGSRMLTGLPHMHGIGTAFSQRILHANGTTDPVLTLQGWSFDSQLFYDLPVTFAAGDRIVTHCDYNNTRDQVTRQGPHTTDEMCFNFAYVTPAPTTRFCDEVINPSTETGYRPGVCALPGAPTDLPLSTGHILVGEAPALTGGAIPAGRWQLDDVTYYLSTATTAAGSIDLTQSAIRGRGQVWMESGRVVADINSALTLVLTGGVRFAREIPLSFAATFPSQTTPLALTPTCPMGATMGVPSMLHYAVNGERMTLGVPTQMNTGVGITPRFTFHRVP